MGHPPKYLPSDAQLAQRRVQRWDAIYATADDEFRALMNEMLKTMMRNYQDHNTGGINGFGVESAKELAVAMAERTRSTAKGRVMC